MTVRVSFTFLCVFRLYRTKCVSFRLVFALKKSPVTCWSSSCGSRASRKRRAAFRRCRRSGWQPAVRADTFTTAAEIKPLSKLVMTMNTMSLI